MRFGGCRIAVFVIAAVAQSFAQDTQIDRRTTGEDARSSTDNPGSTYVPVHKFDPKRDATADIQAAVAEAQRTGKRIIVDVGGDWCTWCHVLDKFFERHPEITDLRDRNFLTVAVFYSHEDKNEKALS